MSKFRILFWAQALALDAYEDSFSRAYTLDDNTPTSLRPLNELDAPAVLQEFSRPTKCAEILSEFGDFLYTPYEGERFRLTSYAPGVEDSVGRVSPIEIYVSGNSGPDKDLVQAIRTELLNFELDAGRRAEVGVYDMDSYAQAASAAYETYRAPSSDAGPGVAASNRPKRCDLKSLRNFPIRFWPRKNQ